MHKYLSILCSRFCNYGKSNGFALDLLLYAYTFREYWHTLTRTHALASCPTLEPVGCHYLVVTINCKLDCQELSNPDRELYFASFGRLPTSLRASSTCIVLEACAQLEKAKNFGNTWQQIFMSHSTWEDMIQRYVKIYFERDHRPCSPLQLPIAIIRGYETRGDVLGCSARARIHATSWSGALKSLKNKEPMHLHCGRSPSHIAWCCRLDIKRGALQLAGCRTWISEFRKPICCRDWRVLCSLDRTNK